MVPFNPPGFGAQSGSAASGTVTVTNPDWGVAKIPAKRWNNPAARKEMEALGWRGPGGRGAVANTPTPPKPPKPAGKKPGGAGGWEPVPPRSIAKPGAYSPIPQPEIGPVTEPRWQGPHGGSRGGIVDVPGPWSPPSKPKHKIKKTRATTPRRGPGGISTRGGWHS